MKYIIMILSLTLTSYAQEVSSTTKLSEETVKEYNNEYIKKKLIQYMAADFDRWFEKLSKSDILELIPITAGETYLGKTHKAKLQKYHKDNIFDDTIFNKLHGL